MTGVQDTLEMTGVQDLLLEESRVRIVLIPENQKVINFYENKKNSIQMVRTNFMKQLKKNCMKSWVGKPVLVVDLKMKEL